MTFETTLVTRTGHPIGMAVANHTTIEKGTSLKLSGSGTCAASAAVADDFAGIAAAEKIASDGVTQLAVYREGRFKVYVSGSAAIGDPAVTSTPANYFQSARATAGASLSGSKIAGIFLEAATTGQTALMELKPIALGV